MAGFGPPVILPPSSAPNCHNYRQYADGLLQPRPGLVNRGVVGAGAPVHSIFRLNDGTPLAAHPALRIVGSGTHAYQSQIGSSVYADLGGGFSGHPLIGHPGQPPNAAQPWLYLADSAQMRKVNVNGVVYPVGTAPPLAPPTVALQPLGLNIIDRLNGVGPWTAAGAGASAPAPINRINTTITSILYDTLVNGNPVVPSYASITLASFANVTADTFLDLSGGPEGVFIEAITIPIAPTTVKSIIYDNPQVNIGLCTIQPAASLGTGQLEMAPTNYSPPPGGGPYAVPRGPGVNLVDLPPTNVTRIRQVDFPVNCVISFPGIENVRVLSVAVGKDGVQSFRCSTINTIAAGTTMVGLPAVRVYTQNVHVVGEIVAGYALTQTQTPGAFPTGQLYAAMTGGIQAPIGINLAQINGRATLPDDDIHVSLLVDRLSEVTTVRVYFDVNAAGVPAQFFLQNYYFFEWRANDIIAAIQATNAGPVSSVDQARLTTIGHAQINQPITGTAIPRGTRTQGLNRVGSYNPPGGLPGTAANAISTQLAIGNNQWIELRCKVSQLIHAGSDPAQTLANVQAVEILVASQATGPLNVRFHGLYLSGGFGADVGDIGAPYLYRQRFRGKSTGVVSSWGPPTPAGVIARRQRIVLTPQVSTDAQVDTIDYARLGGSLTEWTYTGSSDVGQVYNDDVGDSAVVGGAIAFTDFQPWPIGDLPRKGFCRVSGNAVQWISGDTFNPLWAPGSVIFLNGIPCTLYQSPSAFYAQFNLSPILFVNENASSGLEDTSNVQFYLPNPTIQGQPLPTLWGGVLGYAFACGDPLNPATLYWTNTQTLDAANEANTLVVSNDQSSEPLQNGCLWDSTAYVFSTQDLYRIEPSGSVTYAGGVALPAAGGGSLFNTTRTACGRGLWSRLALATRPEGIYFLTGDGLAITQGGSPAQFITGEDLRPLFPKDGQPGQSVTSGIVTVQPPDMTQTDLLRLTDIDNLLYFDYLDTSGAPRTLVYDPLGKQWLLDQYSTSAGAALGVRSRVLEHGPGVHQVFIGGDNGVVYLVSGTTDDGTPISWLWATAPTSHGAPGYIDVHDGVLAYQAAAPLTLQIIYDGVAQQYTLPATANLYQRVYGLFAPGKGLSIVYGLTSAGAFRVFKEDCAVRVQPWGKPGGYTSVQPFGGARLRDGAIV